MNAIPLVFNAPKANINVNSVGPINVNSIRTNNKLINATQGMNISGAAGMLGGGGFSNEVQLRQEVNTSIVALKREAFSLENLIAQAAQTLQDVNKRLSELEGKQGDYVKKSDVVDSITSGNMNPVTSNAVANSNAMPVNSVTSGNMHSVTSGAVAKMFEQMCFPSGFQFFENFDVSYESGGVWYDYDVWWRVFEGTEDNANYNSIYAEITVINTGFFHSPPNVTKYIVSPQYMTSPDPAVIQLYKSNSSCHGIRVGRNSNNHWFVDLQLKANYYTIFAQGKNFKRSTKLSKVTMSGFAYVSQIDN